MHESRIYYNLAEANAMVPRLEFLFSEMARIQMQVNALSHKARELGIELDLDETESPLEGMNPTEKGLREKAFALSREYAAFLDEIQEIGVVVDDIDFGIVNFYSWVGGNEIFLSWQYGEPEVLHWHAVTENSVSRRPLRSFSSGAPAQILLN